MRDVVEDEVRALKLFESAAGYDAVRREIGALRKVDHPNVVKVIWADRTPEGEWYLILEYVHGELLSNYTDGKAQLRDREAIDVGLDVLSALEAIHPDSERLDELERKKLDGELVGAGVRRAHGDERERTCSPRHQAAEHHAHPLRGQAPGLQHRLPRR